MSPAGQDEFSELWNSGTLQIAPFRADRHVSALVDDIPVVMAQSSTIRGVYRDPRSSEYRLALDLGHGQYGGRYTQTLRALERRGMQVILSFWRDLNRNPAYRWYEGSLLSSQGRVETSVGDWIDLLFLDSEHLTRS